MKIARKVLQSQVDALNGLMGTPPDPYIKIGDGYRPCIGNYHLHAAYGRIGVEQMANDAGGVSTTIQLGTIRETSDALRYLLQGIRMQQGRMEVP